MGENRRTIKRTESTTGNNETLLLKNIKIKLKDIKEVL